MKNYKLKFLLLASCFLLLASMQQVDARSCDKSYISIEEVYISSEIVFLGGLYEDDLSGDILFSIDELYKAPPSFKEGDALVAPAVRYEPTEEKYIIYGKIKERDGKKYIYSNKCGRSKYLPALIEESVKFPESSKLSFYERTPIILSGKVVSVHHRKLNRRQIKSEIEFKVAHIYKNSSGEKIVSNENNILVITRTCGQKFKIDNNYLVFIKHRERRGEKIKNYSTSCYGTEMVNLDELGILRKLAKYKNYSGDK